jgi:hypothetical protein
MFDQATDSAEGRHCERPAFQASSCPSVGATSPRDLPRRPTTDADESAPVRSPPVALAESDSGKIFQRPRFASTVDEGASDVLPSSAVESPGVHAQMPAGDSVTATIV